MTSIDTTRLAETGDGSHALNNATRAIATNMQRWNGDSTVPVDYFAPDARELVDVGDANQLDSEADRLLSQGDHENGSLLREIAQASPQMRLVVAEVGRLGVRLAEALSLAEKLQAQLAAAAALHGPVEVPGRLGPCCKASHGPAWVSWPCKDAVALGLGEEAPDAM